MRFLTIIALLLVLAGCGGKSMNKILKSPDPAYKLRMAEKYFVEKKYHRAQVLYEDVMPYYKTQSEFEDIYYKYAYCAYYQKDYLNAENLFKTFLEIFPNSTKAEEIDYMRSYCFFKQSPKAELDQTNTIKAIGMMQVFINTHPGSSRNEEAQQIIDELRAKLELKDEKSAKLYFDMGQYRAAGVTYTTLLNSFPESQRADEYQLMVIRSYFKFAEMSIDEKKAERFEEVIRECREFTARFPESALRKEADSYLELSQTNIKNLRNEQAKTAA